MERKKYFKIVLAIAAICLLTLPSVQGALGDIPETIKNDTNEEESIDINKISQEGYELLKKSKISEAKKKFIELLEIDPKNNSAALNAAIALANMQNKKEAQEYFSQSVSDAKPKREALLSYAAFSEQSQEYNSALKLLKKHDNLHGETLNSMLTAARIYDKQGQHEVATEKYRAILLSGFRVPPDLTKYIKNRLALSPSM